MIHDLSVCVVLDKIEEKILIQHGNLDTNIYYLEIKNRNTSVFYEFPDVTKIGPGDYSAKLVPENDEHILIDGNVFHLIELKN